MNSPRRNERFLRDATNVPDVGIERDRVLVLLGRDSDRYVLLVFKRMGLVVDDEPRPLIVRTEFERVGTPNHVASSGLYLLVSCRLAFTRMGLVRCHSVPLVGIYPAVFLVKSLRNRVEFVRVGYSLQVLR